ncbi:MAG: Y4yA family PLP-dependent enzyme [Mycobacteriaceae bacterium]|nr:Y4yA family PLP-dependent enzyme [Mycobacteriaceae bacterium]
MQDIPDEGQAAPEPSRPSIVAPPLPAYRDELHERVLGHPTLLGDIAHAVGGPFHLMYPDRVAHNIAAFRAVFANTGVAGAVYYAKKANKAACVVRTCAKADAAMEVSSLGELTAAMAGGIRGTDLMVTGPGKSDDLLWPAIRHGALIAVDALDELERIAAVCRPDMPAWVLLRVRPPASTSRFGLTETELSSALHSIDPDGSMLLEGFSFHLSDYEVTPRATLAAALVDRCLTARTFGHPASTISIGGGFGVDYVAAADWARFTENGPDQRWFHPGAEIADFYPYHFARPGADMLTDILGTAGLSERLRNAGIRLAVEPGRALLDRAGCTVFGVRSAKARAADAADPHNTAYRFLTVDGTSFSLSEQWFGSEYLPDPVLWPHDSTGSADPHEPTPSCVGGASCLEADMVSRRRVALHRAARVGDLLVYPNTAGYQMDSNESGFHELPLPPKIVLHEQYGYLRWTLDR